MRPQVAGEGVPAAAGIVAEVALERLLARVQLDVAQQVALLGEGGPALVALERPLTWARREEGGLVRTEPGPLGDRRAAGKLLPMGLVISTAAGLIEREAFRLDLPAT